VQVCNNEPLNRKDQRNSDERLFATRKLLDAVRLFTLLEGSLNVYARKVVRVGLAALQYQASLAVGHERLEDTLKLLGDALEGTRDGLCICAPERCM